MLNFPNLDTKNGIKEEMEFEDFKQLVRVRKMKWPVVK